MVFLLATIMSTSMASAWGYPPRPLSRPFSHHLATRKFYLNSVLGESHIAEGILRIFLTERLCCSAQQHSSS
jgi:hypothetical protein